MKGVMNFKEDLKNKKYSWFIVYILVIVISSQLAGIVGVVGAVFALVGMRGVFSKDYKITKKIVYSALFIAGGIIISSILLFIVAVGINLFAQPPLEASFQSCRDAYPGTDEGNLFYKDNCIFEVVYANPWSTLEDCDSLLTDIHERSECNIAVAAIRENYSICNLMEQDIMRDGTSYSELCLEIVAFELLDIEGCKKITNIELKDLCNYNINKEIAGEELMETEKVWRVLINDSDILGVGEYIGQKFQLIKNTNISIEFISDLPVYTCIATEEEFDNYLEGENYFCVGGSVSDETTEDYSEGMLEAGNYVYLFDSNEKTEIKYELLIGILE